MKAILLVFVLLTACDVAYTLSDLSDEGSGLHICECEAEGMPVYVLDSDSTNVWLGTSGSRFEFTDLITGKDITLHENSNLSYDCSRQITAVELDSLKRRSHDQGQH